ncbi:MAG: Nif3-like dinuclear metal center hexameric protein [Acidobacteriaceae bacterium]|nr:Nif3-like dinuclear metal center hexameric protein [Acidobacteriaceae bacterium]
MQRLIFALLLSCLSSGPAVAQPPTATARQLVALIHQHLNVQLPATTVDTFKAGDPDTPVTGIAVTMMATFDVLERAAASGDNLIITHEPTFYNHQDTTNQLEKEADPVLAEKQKFIAAHHLVVWRFHDGWHARNPDGILLGMTQALGWQKFQTADQKNLFTLPETTITKLAFDMKRKLDIRVLRVVGDPEMKVKNVAFLPGAAGSARQIAMLEKPEVEALIIGETPEWETVEYVADAASEGKRKALLILGHIPSEQEGMRECADWLRTFISAVPIGFIPAREPFWVPLAAGKNE